MPLSPQSMCALVAEVRQQRDGWQGTARDVWDEVGSGDLSRLHSQYQDAMVYKAALRGIRLTFTVDQDGWIVEHQEPMA